MVNICGHMKGKSEILLGILVGILLGLWLSQNHSRGQFWFSNPFAPPNASEQMANDLLQAWQETHRSLGQPDY
jgi:hypothetical protein